MIEARYMPLVRFKIKFTSCISVIILQQASSQEQTIEKIFFKGGVELY
jgi:hypothetical protein